MHEKIRSHHLERNAILYVRQSSAQSGPAQSREQHASIRDARPYNGAWLVSHRHDR